MVEYGGRYRPRNATWYEEMDKGFLQTNKPQKARLKRPRKIPKPVVVTEADKVGVDAKTMLGKMVKTVNGMTEEQKVKQKIFGNI